MKKLVTTLCTLVCTLCLFSLFAACEDTDKQTTLSYDLTDETCTVSGGTVVDKEFDIPSSYNGHTVTDIGQSAFKDNLTVTSVTIPDGVTKIGQDAFYGCRNLESVTIPQSVTSIGTSAFYNCSKLTNIYYKGDVASWCAKTDLSGLMRYGNAQKILHIGGSQISGTLTVPDGVTKIGKAAFYRCNGLTGVFFPNSLTALGDWAFAECPDLLSVTVSEKVTSIGEGVFRSCSKLESVTYNATAVPQFAFHHCYALTSVALGITTNKIDENAFAFCTALNQITIPNSVTKIGANAFSACSALKKAVFITANGWKVIKGGDNDEDKDVSKDITDSETAANYLINNYADKDWERS